MMERNADKPILVTRDESTTIELLRAALVVAPLAYTGLLLYAHLTTGEVSAFKVWTWAVVCPIAAVLSRYVPRKYLILYDTYVFGGIALKKWVFVLSRKIPYEKITSISLSKGIGPTTMLAIQSGWPSITLFLLHSATLRNNLRILAERVGHSVFDEDAKRFLHSNDA
jgi:hypothetical protein